MSRQRLRSPRRIAQLPEEDLGDLVGLVLGEHVLRGAALADRAVEELAGARRTEKCADAHGACRLTEDRHLAGIAPEAVDVVAHPLESGDLIAQAGVAGVTELLAADPAQMHVAQRAQAVVDRDHHDVAAARQVLPFVDGGGTRADQKATAVDPHQDRTPRTVEARRPDIEGEAVLGLPGTAGVQEAEQRYARLDGNGAGARRVPRPLPRLRRLRRPEAAGARGRARKGNPPEAANSTDFGSANSAVAGVDLGVQDCTSEETGEPSPRLVSLESNPCIATPPNRS